MARRKVEGTTFYADFSGVEHAIGAAWGILGAVGNKQYRDDLIHEAYYKANNEFNLEAAAFAAAGGNIKHMFEWGTVGINNKRSNMRPNPMSENARLWRPVLAGHGPNYQLDFTFKPSVAFVPKPTSAETGMDSSVIADMRDHVFYNKAMVMESGMTVTIRLKEAEFLLFPFYKGQIPPNARSHDIARGYTLNPGPVSLRPGANTAGVFNTYWTQFWQERGNEKMDMSVQEAINKDFAEAMASAKSTAGLKRVISGMVEANIKKEAARVERNARRRAAYRAKKEQANG